MTRIEGSHELPPYVPDVQTLFDLSDMAQQMGDDYLMRILEDIANSTTPEETEV